MVNQHGRPVVVVTRPALPGAGLGRLAKHVEVVRYEGDAAPTLDQLAPLLGRADGLLSMTTDRVDAHLLDTAPRLRVVSNAGVGTDNLELPELTARGIPAGNTPGVLVETTADLAFALILASARRIVEATGTCARGAGRASRSTCSSDRTCTTRRSGSWATGRSGARWLGAPTGSE
jgi:glyoxylate reductase